MKSVGLAWVVVGLLASGCAYVSPRYDPAVQRSFVQDEMRMFETKTLRVYYPAHAKETVLGIASRLEACTGQLRALAMPESSREKLVVIFTSAEFNNAYVMARALGNPTQMVLPLQMGVELFNYFDFGVSNIGDVACHEAAHYVQLQQTEGFWRYLNLVFGDVMSPNVGTESWFLEGLATYAEGHLGREHGRPHSPLWSSTFYSGVSSQGELQAGQLSFAHRRQYPNGGNYLTGSHFVSWLGKKYGDDKLWELVELQGRSIFFPFWVTLRFKGVYGKTIGGLLHEYEQELLTSLAARPRPENQEVLAPDLGYSARLASAGDGSLAIAWVGVDHISTLEVREPDGGTRFSIPLAQLVPERPWIVSSPTSMSGLNFTRDGRWLFLFSEDVDLDGESTYAVRQFDARNGAFVRQWGGLRGLGGDVTPDGQRYVFVTIREGVPQLSALHLDDGRVEVLHNFGDRRSLGGIAVAPDGQRVAFSARKDEQGFDLYLRESDGRIRPLTHDGRFNYGARWANDDELVLMREQDGTSQAFSLKVSTGELTQLTQAPWAVFDPVPLPDGELAFLNRDGWHWSLDRLTTVDAFAPVAASATATPEATEAMHELKIEDEAPYSALDSLFVPRLRVPYLTVTTDQELKLRPGVGLSLMGFDRLGYHSWAINAAYDGTVKEPSASVVYGTGLLAPWYLEASVSREVVQANLFARGEPLTRENLLGIERTTDLSAVVFASRPLWTSSVFVGAEALWRSDRIQLLDGTFDSTERVRWIGPSAGFSWSATDGTAYAGVTRGLSANVSVGAYPKALGSDYTIADTRAAIGAWIPLPVLQRHSFLVTMRLRAVPGPVQDLLQVGGITAGTPLLIWGPDTTDAPEPSLLTPGIAFSEPVRGFEDVAFRANAVAIAGARYRYPLIIDRGVSSVLWLFPSAFWRQVEFEGFAEAARTDDRAERLHVATGASIRSRFLWSGAPFSVFAQYAYRFDPGLASQVLVGFSLD